MSRKKTLDALEAQKSGTTAEPEIVAPPAPCLNVAPASILHNTIMAPSRVLEAATGIPTGVTNAALVGASALLIGPWITAGFVITALLGSRKRGAS
jgi:hypothetical protein